MKERSGMPYDVVAFETDENALGLTSQEEGIFHRMIRKSWVNGSVPADLVELAHLCRERPSVMKKAWPRLSKMWVPIRDNPSRLVNKKTESERAYTEKIRLQNRRAGKLSAKLRKIKKDASTTVEQPLDNRSTPLPAPSQPVPVPIHSSNPEVSTVLQNCPSLENPPTENRGGRPDLAADLFAAAYETQVGNPYGWLAGDFPQLAKLRKRLKIGSVEAPADWEAAIANYFATPFAEYSLQHFAAKFDTFKNSRLDRFKTPVDHVHGGSGNGRPKTKQEQTLEAAERLRARWSAEDSGSGEREP